MCVFVCLCVSVCGVCVCVCFLCALVCFRVRASRCGSSDLFSLWLGSVCKSRERGESKGDKQRGRRTDIHTNKQTRSLSLSLSLFLYFLLVLCFHRDRKRQSEKEGEIESKSERDCVCVKLVVGGRKVGSMCF